MNPKHKFLAIALVAATILLVTGCGGTESSEEPAPPPDEVSMQFSWINTIEFAGFYLAEAEGYYADENLNVDLLDGGFDDDGNYIDPIDVVLSGEADFGDQDAGILLEARADGAPLVAIASIYQRHPLAFISLAERNIERPEDLAGNTVDVSDNSLVVYNALLSSQDIDPDSVNSQIRTDFTIDSLVNGDIDVIDAWVTNEVVELGLGGYDINVILASDYGVEVYPNVIFTTEDMVENHPDVVERFLQATLRGTQMAIDDPENAAAETLTRNADLDIEKETESMFQALPLLNPAGSQPGMMSASSWETTQDIMLEQDLLDAPLDLDQAYTLEFLNDIYEQG